MLHLTLAPVDCVLFIALFVCICFVVFEQGRSVEVDKNVNLAIKLHNWEEELIRREDALSDAIDQAAHGTVCRPLPPPHDYSGVEKFSG